MQFHEKSDVKEGLLEDLREQTVKEGLKWVQGRVSHVEKKGDQFRGGGAGQGGDAGGR